MSIKIFIRRRCIFILTNIAPNGRKVDGVPIPQYGVYKLVQTSYACPNHIHRCTSSPSWVFTIRKRFQDKIGKKNTFKMPWKWENAHNDSNESEKRKKSIRIGHHIHQPCKCCWDHESLSNWQFGISRRETLASWALISNSNSMLRRSARFIT